VRRGSTAARASRWRAAVPMSSCNLGRKRWTSCANKFGRSSKKASRGGAHHGDGRMAAIRHDLARVGDLRRR
jgi:hypothetical protein